MEATKKKKQESLFFRLLLSLFSGNFNEEGHFTWSYNLLSFSCLGLLCFCYGFTPLAEA